MRRPVSILAALLLAAPFTHTEVAASASSSLARFMDGEIPVPFDWERELEEGGDSSVQSFLFTGAPTFEPIAPEAVTSAPTASEEEEDPSTVTPTRGPTVVPPVEVTQAPETVTAAPTASEEEEEEEEGASTTSPTAVPPVEENETLAPTPVPSAAVSSAPTASEEEEPSTSSPTALPSADAESETAAPTPVSSAAGSSEEEEPSTSSPTALPSTDVESETAAPTPVASAAGSSPEEDEEVDAQGTGGDSSAPAGTGGELDGAPSSGTAGGDGEEITPEATAEPVATPETETPAATPEAVESAAETPVATPAPSVEGAVPVTTIVLELAGSTAQKLDATTMIVAEIERVLKTEATFSSARRALNAGSSTPFFPAAVRRALQDTTAAGALCASSEMPKSVVTITLSNYDDTSAATTLLKKIIGGTTPLTLEDGTAVRDTICKEEVSLKMVSTVNPVSPMDDVAKDESGSSSGLGTDAVIAIAVLVPATVLLFIFFAYRRRSNSRVAQV